MAKAGSAPVELEKLIWWIMAAPRYRRPFACLFADLPCTIRRGPDVGIPEDPSTAADEPKLATRVLGYIKLLLIGVASASVFWLGWRIEVPVLNWILMIIGGFFVSVVLFLLGIFLFGPKPDSGF